MVDDDGGSYYYDNPDAGPTDGGDNFQYGNGGVGAPGASGNWLTSLLSSIGNLSPGLLGALLGSAGPVAGLVGNLASGGVTGNQSQNSNSSLSGSTSGFNNTNQTGTSQTQQTGSSQTTGIQNQTQTSNQTGFQNATSTPTLDPRASATADRLNAALGGGFGTGSQGMYGDAMSLLASMAGGGGNNVVTPRAPQAQGAPSAGSPGAVNTTPQPAAITGFPNRLPSDIDQGLVNLIKSAFGSFTGDIANSAITNARARGFAGGADLLGTAGAPIASGALAQVPAQQAKAYLEHVLSRYTAESENAARKAGAEANALNAATNALQPGIQQYTADSNRLASQYGADSSRIASMYGADTNRYLGELDANSKSFQNNLSLIQAMMDPQKQWLSANLGLLNALPHGTTSNTLSGQTGTSTLSGTNTSNTNSASVSNTNSNQSSNTQSGGTSNQSGSSNSQQSQSQPIGNVVGNGLGNVIAGAGQGYAAGAGNNSASLLAQLLRGA